MLGEGGGTLNVGALTTLFFGLYLLAATQDIAVDGWALTMLKPRNVGYASTCNSVGQQTGWLVSFTGFLALNHWGYATLAGFMQAWGVFFIIVTVFVALFKPEGVDVANADEGVREVYRQTWAVLKLDLVKDFALVLLTWKIAFAANDAMSGLKLIEMGMPKEHVAYISSIMAPAMIIVTAAIARYTSGPRPLDIAMKVYPWRIGCTVATACLLFFAPVEYLKVGGEGGATATAIFYVFVVLLMCAQGVLMTVMFTAQMSFFAKVSDPAIGGTYMVSRLNDGRRARLKRSSGTRLGMDNCYALERCWW